MCLLELKRYFDEKFSSEQIFTTKPALIKKKKNVDAILGISMKFPAQKNIK